MREGPNKMTRICESAIEEAVLDWFDELGWSLLHGPDIAPGEPASERETYSDVIQGSSS